MNIVVASSSHYNKYRINSAMDICVVVRENIIYIQTNGYDCNSVRRNNVAYFSKILQFDLLD